MSFILSDLSDSRHTTYIFDGYFRLVRLIRMHIDSICHLGSISIRIKIKIENIRWQHGIQVCVLWIHQPGYGVCSLFFFSRVYGLTLNNFDGLRAERASAYSSIVISNIEFEIEVLFLLFMRASHARLGAWPHCGARLLK